MVSKGRNLPANNIRTIITDHHKNLLKDNKSYINIIEKTYNHYYSTVNNQQAEIVERAFNKKYGQPFHIMKAENCIIKKENTSINLNQNPKRDFIVIVFTVKGIIVISNTHTVFTKWEIINTIEEINPKTYKIVSESQQVIFIDQNVHHVIKKLSEVI